MDTEADVVSPVGRHLAKELGLLLTVDEVAFLAQAQGIVTAADLAGFTADDLRGVSGLECAGGQIRHAKWTSEVERLADHAEHEWQRLKNTAKSSVAALVSASVRAEAAREGRTTCMSKFEAAKASCPAALRELPVGSSGAAQAIGRATALAASLSAYGGKR
eukprot:SAG22_NODE_1486_length_4323_cov_3.859848_3_plen_162_part_00